MKVVFTYVMITFALSLFLYMGGVIDTTPPSTSVVEGSNLTVYNPDMTHFAAAGIFVDVMNNGIKSSYLWTSMAVLLAIIVFGAAVNSFTGGNASVGITVGLSFLAWWLLGLIGDFISVIHLVGNGCVSDGLGNWIGQCGDIAYWVIWAMGGLLLIGFVYAVIDMVGGND